MGSQPVMIRPSESGHENNTVIPGLTRNPARVAEISPAGFQEVGLTASGFRRLPQRRNTFSRQTCINHPLDVAFMGVEGDFSGGKQHIH
jgi:hypothetical protein